jgi:hypothetical protein
MDPEGNGPDSVHFGVVRIQLHGDSRPDRFSRSPGGLHEFEERVPHIGVLLLLDHAAPPGGRRVVDDTQVCLFHVRGHGEDLFRGQDGSGQLSENKDLVSPCHPAPFLLQGPEDLDRDPYVIRPLDFRQINPSDEVANFPDYLKVVPGRPLGAEIVRPDQDHLSFGEPAFRLDHEVCPLPDELLLELFRLTRRQRVSFEKFQLFFRQGLPPMGPNQERQDGAGDLLASGSYCVFEVEEENVGLGLGCLGHEIPVVTREDVLDRSGGVFPGELSDCRIAGRIRVDPFHQLPPLGYVCLSLRRIAPKGRHYLA